MVELFAFRLIAPPFSPLLSVKFESSITTRLANNSNAELLIKLPLLIKMLSISSERMA